MPAPNVQPIDNQEASARFAEIYSKHAKQVLMYFARRIGDSKDVAEDLMQETFLRAFSHFKTFQDRGFSYLTYLLTIAHNVLANHFRPKRSVPLEEAEELPGKVDDKTISREIDVKALWLAIQDLSEAEREVLFMKYQEDLPVRDIAARCGRTENSVKLLLSRSRKKLAKHPHVTALVATIEGRDPA